MDFIQELSVDLKDSNLAIERRGSVMRKENNMCQLVLRIKE